MISNITYHDDGIITFTREITWLNGTSSNHGWGNGYIGIQLSHKLSDIDYDDQRLPSIHGGWTYSKREEIDGNEYHVFGFDTCHYGDDILRWPEGHVINEINSVVEYFSNNK